MIYYQSKINQRTGTLFTANTQIECADLKHTCEQTWV